MVEHSSTRQSSDEFLSAQQAPCSRSYYHTSNIASTVPRSLWKGAALNLRLSRFMYHSVLSLYQAKIF